jgi:Cdc6-like AAA superfamily ATPase
LWFLDSPEFSNWIHGSNPTLFCPGIPGAGKTIMAATTIDHLSRTLPRNTIGVAYIYCNYKEKANRNTTSLLAAILKQLVQARPSIAEPVRRLYNNPDRTRPSLEEILSALQSILTNYSSVYIVVDALDECQENDGTRSQLLAELRDLQCKADMRLMVTSRFIPDIENEFRLALRLEVRASDEDVKRFVIGQIYRLPRCIQRDSELQRFVQDKIVKAVDGMSAFRTLFMSTVNLRLCLGSFLPVSI